jgi:hypothetical protein
MIGPFTWLECTNTHRVNTRVNVDLFIHRVNGVKLQFKSFDSWFGRVSPCHSCSKAPSICA